MNKYYYEGKTKEQAEELALEELKISKEKLSSLHKELETERIKLKFLLESNEELKNKYIDFYNKNSVLLLSERETFNKTIEILEQINSLSLEKVNINRKVLK